MKELPPRVYVFFGEAVSESPEAGVAPGQKHAVIAFGTARNIDDAAQVAADHFLDSGWTDVRFKEGEELDPARIDDADEDVAATYRQCLEEGSSGIVFDQPMEE